MNVLSQLAFFMCDQEEILKQELKRLDAKRAKVCADVKVFENEVKKLLKQINKIDQERLEVCKELDESR